VEYFPDCLLEGGWGGILNHCIPVILGRFPDPSQVGVPNSVVGVFISSAGPKIEEGCVLDLAHFGKVGVPPGSGPLGDPPGECADLERPQDHLA